MTPTSPQLADHVHQSEAVAARQHDVEDDQIGTVAVESFLEVVAVDQTLRRVAGGGEGLDDHLADRLGILDHQDPRRGAIVVGGAGHGSILSWRT